MKPITLRYKISEDEFMRASRAHWKGTGSSTWTTLIAGFVGLVLGLIVYVINPLFGILLGGASMLLMTMVAARDVLWRRGFHKALKYTDAIEVTFDDESIHLRSAEGTSELEWDVFTGYLHTKEHVLLYVTKQYFSIIPRAAFADGASLKSFEELVNSRLRPIK